jgi:hypothetical protein
MSNPKITNVDLSAAGVIVAFSDGKIYLFETDMMLSLRSAMAPINDDGKGSR